MIIMIIKINNDDDNDNGDDYNNNNNNGNNNNKLRISNVGRPSFDNFLFMHFIVFIKFSHTAPQPRYGMIPCEPACVKFLGMFQRENTDS